VYEFAVKVLKMLYVFFVIEKVALFVLSFLQDCKLKYGSVAKMYP